MERYLLLSEGDVKASNLEYCIDEVLARGCTVLEQVSSRDRNTRNASLRGELIWDESLFNQCGEGYFVIDIPCLGYRLTDVILCPGHNFYDRHVFQLVDFKLEKIYHVIAYKHSKDGKLMFNNPDNKGYTYDLRKAGCYPESVVRAKLEHYHNSENSVAVWTKKIHKDYPNMLAVDYTYREEVKHTLLHGVLEVSDIRDGKGFEKGQDSGVREDVASDEKE
jgi:hypothetical protein